MARDQRREASKKFGGKQRKLGFNDQIKTTNYRDSLYYGRMFLGEQFQEMQVIIDTSSDWLLVEGNMCSTCHENTYDPNTSAYYQEIGDEREKRNYGNIITTRTLEVEDQVCLQFDDGCVSPFKWQIITEQTGIPPQVDGILGLTQGKDPRGGEDAVVFPEDFVIGPLYIDFLQKGGWITEKAFSTHFEGFDGSSFIDFGPKVASSYSTDDEVVTINMEKGFFYSAFPQGIRFGDETTSDQYSLQDSIAIFSTALSFSMVPSSVSAEFFSVLLRDKEYYEKNGLFYVDCSMEFKDIYIMFQERWMQLSGKDMILDISKTQDMSLCVVNIIPNVDDFWVLGNSLYKDYYITHRPVNALLEVAPTEKSRKPPLYKGIIPNKPLQKNYDWWMFLAKFLSSAAVGVGIWVLAEYGFVANDGSWGTLTFLDSASLDKVKAKQVIADKLRNMNEREVSALLSKLEEKQAT